MAGLLESFIAGGQAGAQSRGAREARNDELQLRGLTPQIIAGDPNAISQAAAIDPRRALDAQSVGDDGLRRLKGALAYTDSIREQFKDDPEKQALALEGAYQSSIRPYLARFDPNPPATFAESMPKMEEARARIAMLDQAKGQGRVQSTYIDADGNRVAIMADGSTSVLGKNDAGANQQTLTIDINGVPTQVTFDKRTGRYANATLGGAPSQPAPSQPALAPNGANYQPTADDQTSMIEAEIGRPLTQAERAQIANGTLRIQMPDGGTIGAQPPMQAPMQTPGIPLVGRTAEAEAEAVARAKQGVELETLRSELPMRTNAAVEQAVRIDEGKNNAEKAAAAPATIATLQNSIDSIDALINSPDLDSIVGIGSMNPLNKVPGTKARGLIARADQIAGQAFLAAFNQLKGGGAITEREGAAATAAMARLDRSQGIEDYKSALNDLKAAISPAIKRAQQQQSRGGSRAPSQGPAPGAVQDGYRFRGGNPADPSSWEAL